MALSGVAWQATIDRTHRVPVVTWSGPLVDFLVPITGAGLLSLLVSSVQLYKIVDRSPFFFDFMAWVGLAIVLLNLLGILVFFGEAGAD